MEANKKDSTPLDIYSRWVIIAISLISIVIVVLYSFGWGYISPTTTEMLLGAGCALAVMLIGLRTDQCISLLPPPFGLVLYFFVQLALVFCFGMLLGTYSNWLLSLLVVGVAVEKLKGVWRWLLFFCILLAVVSPLALRFDNLRGSLSMALSFSPAIFFVALFTQLRLNEQVARQKAELLTSQLEKANLQLAAYAIQAEELATTQERNRLAREIHDSLGHALTVVNVQIEAARTVLAHDPARALQALGQAQQLTQQGLVQVRASVAALRESALGSRTLSEAITMLLDELRPAGIITLLQVTGTPAPASVQVELALYRAAQEALTNVRRHARASRVDVMLSYAENERITLTIRDNGIGAASTRGGFGLLGINERVQLLKGKLSIETQPGQGFQLSVSIPLDAQEGT